MLGKEISPLFLFLVLVVFLFFALFACGISIFLFFFLVEGMVGTKGSAIKKMGFVKGI